MQALNVGQTLTDSFTVTTIDGTQQLVTITINGTNDAAVISGTPSGNVDGSRRSHQRHAGHPCGDRQSRFHRWRQPERCLDRSRHRDRKRQRLRQLHADSGRSLGLYARQQQRRGAGTNVGQTLTDTFTAATVDGTTQLVTVTINGANDTAVITGPATGTVVEASGIANGTPGTPTATGDLNAADVDNPNDS